MSETRAASCRLVRDGLWPVTASIRWARRGAELLRRSEPTEGLLHAILQFKHLMEGDVLTAAREIVAAVVAKIASQLETDCRPALLGALPAWRRGR